MIYLAIMMAVILALIVYGFKSGREDIRRFGVMLLLVWVACAAGYFTFA